MKRISRSRWSVGLTLVGLFVLLAGGYLVARSQIHPGATASTRVSVWVEGADAGVSDQLKAGLKKLGLTANPSVDAASADVRLTRSQVDGAVPVLTQAVGAPTKLENAQLVAPVTEPSYFLTSTKLSSDQRASLAAGLKTATPNTWTLAAIGDIIIGRTVYLQMKRYGDPNRPFAYFADAIRGADVALADLECTISDAHTLITDGGMTFASPVSSAAGLKTSGIDAVNVSNNHSFNVGSAGFVDTLDAMKGLGIPTFGGGRSDAEAHTPTILTTHGVKIALLGYSSIVGSTAAGATTPGMAHLTMAPWGTFDESEAVRMEQDIQAAKAQADVVMVYYHWGTEYTHDANADQRQIAHRAIDAGADLILGTHPHWVQGVEWYKDRLITYSLGNFIFDQEWSTKTKQGTFLKASFDGKRLTSAEFVPYQIEDYLQPRPVNDSVAKAILSDIYSHSWWPGR